MGNQASRQRQTSSQAATAQPGAAPAPPAPYAPGSGAPGPHYPPAFRPQVGIRSQQAFSMFEQSCFTCCCQDARQQGDFRQRLQKAGRRAESCVKSALWWCQMLGMCDRMPAAYMTQSAAMLA